jgi:hypothetical protein
MEQRGLKSRAQSHRKECPPFRLQGSKAQGGLDWGMSIRSCQGETLALNPQSFGLEVLFVNF